MSNLPMNSQETNITLKAFNSYYSAPVEIDATILGAMKAFFTKRDFDDDSAESLSIAIITQAKQDNYNPMEILDTLKGLNNVELSGLIGEILNYNRAKTSSLGYAQVFSTNPEIARNILA